MIPTKLFLVSVTKKLDHLTSAGMCDMLTDANFALVESALVSGSIPTNSHNVLLDV